MNKVEKFKRAALEIRAAAQDLHGEWMRAHAEVKRLIEDEAAEILLMRQAIDARDAIERRQHRAERDWNDVIRNLIEAVLEEPIKPQEAP